MSQFEEKAREIVDKHLHYVEVVQGEHDDLMVAISLALGEAFEAGKGESLRERAVVNEAPDGSSPFGLPSLSQVERDELDALRLLRNTLGDGVARSDFKAEIFALQRGAGLARPDRREVECDHCQALGMNTGWGYWKFRCGAEILSDGEPGENECSHVPCERDRNPKECGDGVGLRPLHPGSGGDAIKRALCKAIAIPMQLKDFGHDAPDDAIPGDIGFVITVAQGELFEASCNEAVIRVRNLVADYIANFKIPENWATSGDFQEGWSHACAELVDLFRPLKAANTQSQIEEPALAGDEVDAASASASLTPTNTPEKAHSASVAPKCDCHLHTHQVCDICQGIERKPQETADLPQGEAHFSDPKPLG